MTPSLDYYIPAGSLSIHLTESNIDLDTWLSKDLQKWSWFDRADYDDDDDHSSQDISRRYLEPDTQEALATGPKIAPLMRLQRECWIEMSFRVVGNIGVLRIYILPDDVLRSTIDRSSAKLQLKRRAMLQNMDFSKNGWVGEFDSNSVTGIPTGSQDDGNNLDSDSISLLALFNMIPSPNPDTNQVKDIYSRDAMQNLLNSTVGGLKSTLYPYQGRSAAMMLQKELNPGKYLDPRLCSLKDHNTSSIWYVDPVAGTVLSKPRHYDGPCGGILAEEMGAGKTIICLALILATKDIPAKAPDLYGIADPPTRKRVVSLADMAASCAKRNSIAVAPYMRVFAQEMGYSFPDCKRVLSRNRGYYETPIIIKPRKGRRSRWDESHTVLAKIYLSSATLVVVPSDLLEQWQEEIEKHTDSIRLLVLVEYDELPTAKTLSTYDLVLFSQPRFEKEAKLMLCHMPCALQDLHFKRCIVDEGHRLGNSTLSNRSLLIRGTDFLHFSARWIVTGTPSRGLFGVDTLNVHEPLNEMEKVDLEQIGAMAALYLKARPWANTASETGDTPAQWSDYLMLPRHKSRSHGTLDCLRWTLNSLIVRHRKDDIRSLFPPVKKSTVLLEGSYQDQLSMNIFSMMIIFNSVQSQRTDMDYFFHPRQRRNLLQIVHNLKQSTFFGGSFFTSEEISKAVETAEEFLEERKVRISKCDERLLRKALAMGRIAMKNCLRDLSNQFHEIPVCVQGLPGLGGSEWSLGGQPSEMLCTSASLLLSLQKEFHNTSGEEAKFYALLNGDLASKGRLERAKLLEHNRQKSMPKKKDEDPQTLAGNTKLGDNSLRKARTHGVNDIEPMTKLGTDRFSDILEPTRIVATVSAKMSYLLDKIVKYQDKEKIIVFYENENTAWYLASMLDVLQIQHLIYAKGLKTERRAQYVKTFHKNALFRVLLMDLSQAAFGLDMKGASRVYFISPVLNPQIEAQAIGRVRRISQKKPVSVEILVLKGSIDEVILEQKQQMTQAEQRQAKSVLDVPSIYNWIKNARIGELPECDDDDVSQMEMLKGVHHVFGRGFGRNLHPDDGLLTGGSDVTAGGTELTSLKRTRETGSNSPERQVKRSTLAERPSHRIKWGE